MFKASNEIQNPIARSAELIYTSTQFAPALMKDTLLESGFTEKQIERLLVSARGDVLGILHNNLNSESSLIKSGLSEEQIVEVLARPACGNFLSALTDNMETLKKYCEIPDMVKMVCFQDGPRTVNAFCSDIHAALLSRRVKQQRIKDLAMRNSGYHYLMVYVNNLSAINGADNHMSPGKFYTEVTKYTEVKKMKDHVKTLCEERKVKFIDSNSLAVPVEPLTPIVIIKSSATEKLLLKQFHTDGCLSIEKKHKKLRTEPNVEGSFDVLALAPDLKSNDGYQYYNDNIESVLKNDYRPM